MPFPYRIYFQKYKICLNPHECIFCVISGRLLGFIVSKYMIMVDPLKVKAIIQFSPPSIMCQLQSLQEKENFLHIFIANYPETTKGFMRLLKKCVAFYLDDQEQRSFEALKKYLTTYPLLNPPYFTYFSRDFILYLASSESTIGMVLVQENAYQ